MFGVLTQNKSDDKQTNKTTKKQSAQKRGGDNEGDHLEEDHLEADHLEEDPLSAGCAERVRLALLLNPSSTTQSGLDPLLSLTAPKGLEGHFIPLLVLLQGLLMVLGVNPPSNFYVAHIFYSLSHRCP